MLLLNPSETKTGGETGAKPGISGPGQPGNKLNENSKKCPTAWRTARGRAEGAIGLHCLHEGQTVGDRLELIKKEKNFR